MRHIRTLAIISAALLSGCAGTPEERNAALQRALIGFGAAATGMAPPPMRQTPMQAPQIKASPGVCFYRGDRISGFNRICAYECNGSPYIQTIPQAQFCPLNPS
jgi:hypothetical protein